MLNITLSSDLPPLAEYTLRHRPPLLPPIPDKNLTLILPIAAYWILSLIFHYIDTHDYLPQYRLHTPAEVLKRNRASPRDVVRDVIVQQIIQTGVGYLLNMFDPDAYYGDEMYRTTVWAQRIRLAQRAIPRLLALVGIDGVLLAKQLHAYPQIAGALSGGQYATLWNETPLGIGGEIWVPGFVEWEISVAKVIYWFIVPAMQFLLAVFVVDTWQYFLHRAMHMNQWLYRKLKIISLLHVYQVPFLGLTFNRLSALMFIQIRHLSLSASSSLCSICFWRPLQPSSRRVTPGHNRGRNCLQGCWPEHKTGNVLLHRFNHQNG